MPVVDRPLRRDAERNRQRLLAAARELFAERGLSVTLDDIAAHAGVGVGTAYRRFGSREALIDALFEERVEETLAIADRALEADDPWEGLAGWMAEIVALFSADRGLKEVLLGSSEGRTRIDCMRAQMRPRAEELVRRAQAAGVLRDDFHPTDLPLMQMMASAVVDVAPPDRPDLWRRTLALLLDGLRAPGRPRPPLPEPPLDFEDIPQVMCRWRPPRAQ